MTVYGATRIPIDKEDWKTCPKCEGHGVFKIGKDHFKCDNILCDSGYVKFKMVRASVTSIQDAENNREDKR